MDHTIGQNVRRLREAYAWTQEDLAAKSKKPVRTIQRVETGEVLPTADTLITLAETLGVTVEDLRRTPEEKARLLAAAIEQGKRLQEKYEVVQLQLIERASQLSPHIEGANAMLFQNVDLKTEPEEDAVASLRQLLHDYMDLWGMCPEVQHRDGEKAIMSFMETELRPLNLVVAAGSHHRTLRLGGGRPMAMTFLCVMVSRTDEPVTLLGWDKKAPVQFA